MDATLPYLTTGRLQIEYIIHRIKFQIPWVWRWIEWRSYSQVPLLVLPVYPMVKTAIMIYLNYYFLWPPVKHPSSKLLYNPIEIVSYKYISSCWSTYVYNLPIISIINQLSIHMFVAESPMFSGYPLVI